MRRGHYAASPRCATVVPHQSPRRGNLHPAGPPPLGRRTLAGLADRLPPDDPPPRTLRSAVHRIPHLGRRPDLLQEAHHVRRVVPDLLRHRQQAALRQDGQQRSSPDAKELQRSVTEALDNSCTSCLHVSRTTEPTLAVKALGLAGHEGWDCDGFEAAIVIAPVGLVEEVPHDGDRAVRRPQQHVVGGSRKNQNA